MKNTLKTIIAVTFYLIGLSAFAQAPQKFSYQAVIRNSSNQIISNQQVSIKISILQGSETGNVVFSEFHSPTTNYNGLITIQIGTGNNISGSIISIDWANGPYFIQSETDPNGGENYSITSTSQLLSVPYALFSSNGIPAGGSSGQVLTNCNGIITWTYGGQCPPEIGSITALNCNLAINTGTITSDIPANGVTSSVPYTGGNEGPHNGQIVNSTGVIGLTASLESGNFINGSSSLIYTITGTASASGIASFALNVGGQNCILNITVNQDGILSSDASCGASNVHNNALTYGNMTDQEGNVYKTIMIGTQEWMAENLKTNIYSNGDIIPNVVDDNQWTNLNMGAWCNYNNDLNIECPHGKLYNWLAVSDLRNVCPAGWHVPTDEEWTTLTDFLGGYLIAGGKLKSTGIQYWIAPNQDATNESGFSGLPGGYRSNFTGTFDRFDMGYYWSSTEYDSSLAWTRDLFSDLGAVNRILNYKRNGLSVRCLKN